MTRTSKLYVNLGASQVRKRLKGHGFGVRQVQAADRNRSVILHTATGQHLRELRALFRDVLGEEVTAYPGEIPLANLRNLGPASAAWLHEIGVHNRADLERVGPLTAWRLVRQNQPTVSLNLLWSLVAALQDIDWRDLPEAEKVRLKQKLRED
jgi:hypothetical protein